MFSLERLKKDFVSEEILGLKKVESGQKKILVGNTFWVQEKALSDFVTLQESLNH